MWLNEIFTRSFASIKANYITWLTIGLIFTILRIPSVIIFETTPGLPDTTEFDFSALTKYLAENRAFGPLEALDLLSLIISILIAPGVIALGLMGAKGQSGKIGVIADKASLALKIFGFSILYIIMIFFGTIALVIPGIYLALRYFMTPFILVEKGNIGVFDAMKESSEIMKNNFWKVLFNLIILGFTIAIASVITLAIVSPIVVFSSINNVLGIVITQIVIVFLSSITYPMWGVGSAVVYTKVSERKSSKDMSASA